ncbi:glycosyltransferase family 87 protein [Robbsia sp. KACC 23696]|uniref:glycosyltransferase family 87 protein n=1 Tax=Robbsia sp. KACC 23696 TaxID=3149231 RepID=UPI00325B7686
MQHDPSQSPPHWLTKERLRLYAWAALAVPLVALLRIYYFAAQGKLAPGGYDFGVFWSVSSLALHGHAIDSYTYKTMLKVAVGISPDMTVLGPWLYPPTFLLMIWPLALLPFPFAYIVFEGLTTLVLVLLLRRVLPMTEAFWPIVAFCCFLPNLMHGQNGALTACLGLAALLLLSRNRQILGGVCIGLLSIKPQLAILFPIALLCARMWPAILSAALTTVVFAAVAEWIVGPGAFAAFVHANGFARQALVDGSFPWWQMTTVYATLRLLHVPFAVALVAHGAVALAATAATGWIWLRRPPFALRAAALVPATFLISPYLYIYDAIWLSIPIAFTVQHALQYGWRRGERTLLLIVWLIPVSAESIAQYVHVGIGPVLCIALLVLLVMRTLRDGSAWNENTKIFHEKVYRS